MTTNPISGMIKRCGELYTEQQTIRDKEAEIRLDVEALDSTLLELGYEGGLEAAMPRAHYTVTYKRDKLSRACMRVVRETKQPLTTL